MRLPIAGVPCAGLAKPVNGSFLKPRYVRSCSTPLIQMRHEPSATSTAELDLHHDSTVTQPCRGSKLSTVWTKRAAPRLSLVLLSKPCLNVTLATLPPCIVSESVLKPL